MPHPARATSADTRDGAATPYGARFGFRPNPELGQVETSKSELQGCTGQIIVNLRKTVDVLRSPNYKLSVTTGEKPQPVRIFSKLRLAYISGAVHLWSSKTEVFMVQGRERYLVGLVSGLQDPQAPRDGHHVGPTCQTQFLVSYCVFSQR